MEQTTNQPRPTRPYRPPIGVPGHAERRRAGAVVSVGLHLLLVVLVVAPFASPTVISSLTQGAGGPGPAGGGGGGRGGTGGMRLPTDNERLRYIQVAPDPTPTPKPVAVQTPPPTPTPPPLEIPKPALPTPETKADTAPSIKPSADVAPTPGTGGGSGHDGTTGAGPGSGGGTGTGVGTGRGSGVGPGTGGGTQANYPPLPIEMFLPPMPIPDRLRGFRMIAEFDVDETGHVVSFTFTETRDGGYNRRLREVLRSIRFRPGARADGTPVRMKAQIEYIL